MITCLLAVAIGGYSIFLIVRKIRRLRRGQFCDCRCANCPGGCSAKHQKNP